MFTLATVSLPANSPASSSSADAIILHGPHHSAQKSTSTGPSAFSTSAENVWSVTGLVFVLIAASIFVHSLGRSGARQIKQVIREHDNLGRLGPDQGADNGTSWEDLAQHRTVGGHLTPV